MTTFNDLINEIEAKLSVEIGATGLSNIPENIADPLVQIITHAVGGQVKLYDDLYNFTQGFNINTVSCDNLDAVAGLVGETKQTNKATKYSVVFIGTEGMTIPSNTLFKDNNNVDWSTTSPIKINNGIGIGYVSSPVGFYELSPAELIITTPVLGVSVATNISLVETGFQVESCEQFRQRLLTSPSYSCETENGVVEKLKDEADFVKVIYDAPDCISDYDHTAFVVRGGNDDTVGNIIANHAPLNFARLAGNKEVSISACETVKFIRPCPVGVKIQYWSDTTIEDDQFVDAICEKEGGGLACIRELIPCINHIRFTLIHSRPESLGCTYEDSGIDCNGTVSLINDDCPCSAGVCDDGVFTDCVDIMGWEYPVFVSATKEGINC